MFSKNGLYCLIVLAALAAGVVAAQDPKAAGERAAPPDDRHLSPGTALPSPTEAARWPIPGRGRIVRIVSANPTEPNAGRVYYVAPLFALKSNSKPLAQQQPVVQASYTDVNSGHTTLEFVAVRFDDALKTVARAALAQQYKDELAKSGASPAQLDIRPQPIAHCVIDCLCGDEVLATGKTGSLLSAGNEIPFELTFAPDALAKFRTGARVKFRFAYKFDNAKVAYGEVSEAILDQVIRGFDEVVRSRIGPDGPAGQPILAGQMKELTRTVNAMIVRLVRVGDPQLLPILMQANPQFASLFERQTIEWDKIDNTALRDKLAEMLDKLELTHKDSIVRDRKTTTEEEKGSTKTSEKGGSLGFHIPLGKATADVNGDARQTKVKNVRELLREEYGIRTELDRENKFYKPVSVDVYRYAGTKDIAKVRHELRAVLKVGELTGYLQDTDVPLSFTADTVLAACEQENRRLVEQAQARAVERREDDVRRKREAAVQELTQLKQALAAARELLAPQVEGKDGDTAQDRVVRTQVAAAVARLDARLKLIDTELQQFMPSAAVYRKFDPFAGLDGSVFTADGWVEPVQFLSGHAGHDRSMTHWGTAIRAQIALRFVKSAKLVGGDKPVELSAGDLRRWNAWSERYKPNTPVPEVLDQLRNQPWARLHEQVVVRTPAEVNGFLHSSREGEERRNYELVVETTFGRELRVPLRNFADFPAKPVANRP